MDSLFLSLVLYDFRRASQLADIHVGAGESELCLPSSSHELYFICYIVHIYSSLSEPHLEIQIMIKEQRGGVWS